MVNTVQAICKLKSFNFLISGAAAASRLYVDAISKLAKQAQQGTWGGSSDIGKFKQAYNKILKNRFSTTGTESVSAKICNICSISTRNIKSYVDFFCFTQDSAKLQFLRTILIIFVGAGHKVHWPDIFCFKFNYQSKAILLALRKVDSCLFSICKLSQV